MSYATKKSAPERSFSLPRRAAYVEMPPVTLDVLKPAQWPQIARGRALKPHSMASVVARKGRVIVRPLPAAEAPMERSTADALAAIAATQLHTLPEAAVRTAPSVLAMRRARVRGTALLVTGLLVACFVLGFIFDVRDDFRAGRAQVEQMMLALHREPTWERKAPKVADGVQSEDALPLPAAPPASVRVDTPIARAPVARAPRATPTIVARPPLQTPVRMIPTFEVSQLPRVPASVVGGGSGKR